MELFIIIIGVVILISVVILVILKNKNKLNKREVRKSSNTSFLNINKDIKIDQVSQKEINATIDRLSKICSWVKENEQTDPNAYEMADIFIDISKLGKNISVEAKGNLDYLMQKRMNDFRDRLGVEPDNQTCKTLNSLYDSAVRGELITSNKYTKEYVCKCLGVSLYIEQETKNNEHFKYSNIIELNDIREKRDNLEKRELKIDGIAQADKLYDNMLEDCKESIMPEVESARSQFINKKVPEIQVYSTYSRLSNICDWVRENPNTDPNAYEMADIFIEVSKLGGNIPPEAKENLDYLMQKRMGDFSSRLGMSASGNVCKTLKSLYDSAISGRAVTQDPNSKEYICKCLGVSLYIAQEKINNRDFKYNNKEELKSIREMGEKAEGFKDSEELFKGIREEFNREESIVPTLKGEVKDKDTIIETKITTEKIKEKTEIDTLVDHIR